MSTSADNKHSDAYRMPLRWSKAWTMDPGCSDIKATNNCSTSMRLSSCGREEMGFEFIVVFEEGSGNILHLLMLNFRGDSLNHEAFLAIHANTKYTLIHASFNKLFWGCLAVAVEAVMGEGEIVKKIQ